MQARSILILAALLAAVAGVALLLLQSGAMRADRPAHNSVRERFQPAMPAATGGPFGRHPQAGIGSGKDPRPLVIAHQ